jgi:hypothetical protein
VYFATIRCLEGRPDLVASTISSKFLPTLAVRNAVGCCLLGAPLPGLPYISDTAPACYLVCHTTHICFIFITRNNKLIK